MGGADRATSLPESFLGVLPAEVIADLVAHSAVTVMPVGRFVYEPELAIVQHGLLRAFVTPAPIASRGRTTPPSCRGGPAHLN